MGSSLPTLLPSPLPSPPGLTMAQEASQGPLCHPHHCCSNPLVHTPSACCKAPTMASSCPHPHIPLRASALPFLALELSSSTDVHSSLLIPSTISSTVTSQGRPSGPLYQDCELPPCPSAACAAFLLGFSPQQLPPSDTRYNPFVYCLKYSKDVYLFCVLLFL